MAESTDLNLDGFDRWPIVWTGAGVSPRNLTSGVDQHVSAELKSVLLGLGHAGTATKQCGVSLDDTPAVRTPNAASLVADRVVELEVRVGDDAEGLRKPAPVAREIAGVRERDHDDVDLVAIGGSEFVMPVAHGADVSLTGESGEMAVKDHQERSTEMLAWVPQLAVVIDEFRIGGEIGHLRHVRSNHETGCSIPL